MGIGRSKDERFDQGREDFCVTREAESNDLDIDLCLRPMMDRGLDHRYRLSVRRGSKLRSILDFENIYDEFNT